MSMDADRVGHATRNQPTDITHEVHDVSLRPIAYGGFADIYSGIWTHDGDEVKVAIKVLRVRTVDPASEKLLRQLRGEISVWKRLSHPNIHRLCGLCEGMGPGLAMVSPWYGNGDINAYVTQNATNPELATLKLNLFFDVTSGLRFLHHNFIVHGDIKGGNVLISDEGVARLCDFGLSRLLWGSSQSITHTGVKGTSRWMAPELILNEEVQSHASDIWAAGCLLIEIWCTLQPYHTKKNDHQVMLALSHGEQPARPPAMPDFPWSLVEMCCDFEPMRRPLPLYLMAKLAVELTMPVVTRMVMRGHPLDNSSSELLRAIEVSLNTSDWHVTVELRLISESDLALEVIRMLSLWSFGSPPDSRLYADALHRWCLDIVVHRLQPLPLIDTRMSSGSDDEDNEDDIDKDSEDDEDGLIDPSELRPFARLLAAVDPTYADGAMLRFGRASVGTPICFEEGDYLQSVVWYPDSDRIAVGEGNGTVDILSTSSGATIRRLNDHEGGPIQVAISPDGRVLASCSYDRAIRLWDAETGDAVGEPMLGHTSEVYFIAFSPDGTHIASGSYDDTIRIWSCDTRATVVGPLYGHTRSVAGVAFSPDGSRIVSGSDDNTVRVWDSSTGACILGPLLGHVRDINSVAFSPDGLCFVSGSDDGTLRIWDAYSGEPVGEPIEGHRDSVHCVAYSPDGTRIASCSHDYTIRIWDAATGAPIHQPLRGHTGRVFSVAFSPDGRKLASASPFDGTVRIWDATDDWTRWDI